MPAACVGAMVDARARGILTRALVCCRSFTRAHAAALEVSGATARARREGWWIRRRPRCEGAIWRESREVARARTRNLSCVV